MHFSSLFFSPEFFRRLVIPEFFQADNIENPCEDKAKEKLRFG